ncbi:acetate--CoA ligase [Salsipaludibacter albus]|uniref:acetate--CoA ligase n=1 Tax=Salsipaludibacter albus TaxID=2849650 RepID=UPI001EE4A906|nr:acetate--CoA ligase [Salsipaludibacter albus]MBY5161737.1 acetate--CoA ligase [Salsipaludibacter albus]
MSDAIEDLLQEDRTFPPPEDFRAAATVSDSSLRDAADEDWLGFWADQANHLDWFSAWDTVHEWDEPFATWFGGGTLNASYNCLDRHVEAGHGDQVAYHWVGEPDDRRDITYAELLDEVCRAANALKELGVGRGDRVAIYLPMILELPIIMLACARLGAPHSVVFAGFSSQALIDRINDADCKVLVTADGAWRRGSVFPLKDLADDALEHTPTITNTLVVKRTESDIEMTDGRDLWWHDAMDGQSTTCEPEHMDAEDLLYLLYTSGTTGKPKGVMHTTGGYMTQVTYTHRTVFDLKPDSDVFWCAADIGWVTGHSYIVYGPLANRTTSVMYEGAPNHPAQDRLWEIIAEFGVTQLYTAPTAIRAFMKWGDEHPKAHDLSSLRLLGTVGEPINPEAWIWYHEVIGNEQCPIVDTWWQTETGGMMIAPVPGEVTTKPGSATLPLPGISATIYDEAGEEVEAPGGGYLVLDRPWPSMLRGVWGDEQRFKDTYWSRFDGVYFAGDGAKRDADGYFWLLGRVDDVMNISGHRISTTEVESALVSHPAVAEAAVVGRKDDMTGQAIAAFVSTRGDVDEGEELATELRNHVATMISPIAKPASLLFTGDLPKTRSGKIMRRLLKDIAEDTELGDTTTLADAGVVDSIKERYLSDSAAD